MIYSPGVGIDVGLSAPGRTPLHQPLMTQHPLHAKQAKPENRLLRSPGWRAFFLSVAVSLPWLLAASGGHAAPGDLFESNTSGNINEYTPGGSVTSFATGLDNIYGLVFDSSGNLYVASFEDNTIVKFSPNGQSTIFASGGLNEPIALAIDSAGNIYAGNYGDNTIEKFNANGQGTLFASTGQSNLISLAFNAQGNLFAGSGNVVQGDSVIQDFDPAGVGTIFASESTSGIDYPAGLAFDGSGDLFVADDGSNNIEEFTTGGQEKLFTDTGLDSPNGLAFDSAGNLFVANINYIEEYDANGNGTQFAHDSDEPNYLAFEPAVPEPSTWTMLLAGVGLLGAILLRRLSRTACESV